MPGNVDIGTTWTDLNSLTSSPIGSEFTLQNTGVPADLIEVHLGATLPAETIKGYFLDQIKETYRVTPASSQNIYLRYTRLDNSEAYSRKGSVYWQLTAELSIIPVNAQPQDLYTEPAAYTRRTKVSTVTRQEIQITRGEFFVGTNERAAVPINDDHYSVIIAPSDKYLVIEDVIQDLSFSAVTDGIYVQEMVAYIEGSVTSSFTYTPSSPQPIGRAMISSAINSFPDSTVDIGITAAATGDPEYRLTFNEFYIDLSGNRNTLSQSASSFFEKGRQIILAPNGVALVKSSTTGTATGSADIRTIYFTSEIPIDLAPAMLGIFHS